MSFLVKKIVNRPFNAEHLSHLIETGMDPVLARIFSARGIGDTRDLSDELQALHSPELLLGVAEAAELLLHAFLQEQSICIIADYDCDGATACTVAVRGLKILAAACGKKTNIHYIVPNRFEYGYGLTPEIVVFAMARIPQRIDLLLTVDNGINSVAGVAYAKTQGIPVLITDHHLPGPQRPEAAAIVNPNQTGCTFPSKNLAGVGVIFYLLLACRARLRSQNMIHDQQQARLDGLLDLVAIGTVADCVPLDQNNRILVAQGLKRIRANQMQAGVRALLQLSRCAPQHIGSQDLAFSLAPKINAAGRLEDMSIGIACLLSDDLHHATALAQQLEKINQQRKVLEQKMQAQALSCDHIDYTGNSSICTFHPQWHQGIIGLLAARLKERFFRPTIVFAPGGHSWLKGSGRSIPGLHLKDVLDEIAQNHPGLLSKFGGHAMAVGLTLHENDLQTFTSAFETSCSQRLDPLLLQSICASDGGLQPEHFCSNWARQLKQYVWGQGFTPPVFSGIFTVQQQRLLKDKHLQLELQHPSGQNLAAIWFNHAQLLPSHIHAAYRLENNHYLGQEKLQLLIEAAVSAENEP